MDFMVGLPRTQARFDAIWAMVMVGLPRTQARLNTASLKRLAKWYIKEIFQLHGVSALIVSNRDPSFTSQFWKALQKAMGIPSRILL